MIDLVQVSAEQQLLEYVDQRAQHRIIGQIVLQMNIFDCEYENITIRTRAGGSAEGVKDANANPTLLCKILNHSFLLLSNTSQFSHNDEVFSMKMSIILRCLANNIEMSE